MDIGVSYQLWARSELLGIGGREQPQANPPIAKFAPTRSRGARYGQAFKHLARLARRLQRLAEDA